MAQPPVALRAFPLLSPRCAMREGRHRQRGGAALARRLLTWIAPDSSIAFFAWAFPMHLFER
jgi:hypothetical protein